MIQPIEQLISDPFARLFCRFDAVDPESGAYLFHTAGRGKGGLPKYILILPNVPVAKRESLFTHATWNDGERKFIRAWSREEAIRVANGRLMKMLAKRAQTSEAVP